MQTFTSVPNLLLGDSKREMSEYVRKCQVNADPPTWDVSTHSTPRRPSIPSRDSLVELDNKKHLSRNVAKCRTFEYFFVATRFIIPMSEA